MHYQTKTFLYSKDCYPTNKKKFKNCDGALLTVVEFMFLLLLL